MSHPSECQLGIAAIIGRTIKEIRGLEANSDIVEFDCTDGSSWRMLHDQDCCESVSIADVVGDPADLIGTVINAREETSNENPKDYVIPECHRQESFTWTFYVIQTDKGAVTIRWLGESNGFYSEKVDFVMLTH